MGKKTDKKIKTERINALRKQYDSFLEEDKKRKERNDYILGRLDKMRYSNMAVQLHQTPATFRDFIPPSFSRHPYQAEKLEPTTADRINAMQLIHVNQPLTRPVYQSTQLDVPRNYLEEASFLNEISKKYILIPKLKNTFPNASLEAISSPVAEPVSSAIPDIDSNDWKSKYDILKQLKSNEKKEEISKSVSHEHKNYNQEDIITTYENEIPVKDVTDEVGIELDLKENCVLSDKSDQIQISDDCRDLNTNSFAQSNVFYQNVNDFGEKIERGLQVAEKAIACDQNGQRITNNDNTVKHQTSNPKEEYTQGDLNYENSEKKSNSEQEYVQEVLNNHNTVENLNTYPNQEYVQEVANNDNTVGHQMSYPEQEQEYPIEYEQFVPEQGTNINSIEQVKAFETNNADSAKKPTYSPHEEAIQEYDQVPTSAADIISSDDMVDGNIAAEITPVNYDAFEAGIEEFEAEQRELFDPQITDENYTHYEQDGTYDAEYSQEQNYPESQQYDYYGIENTQQEFQPVEINEHEETQQDFDPAYEQQYTSHYDQTQEEQQQHVYMEPDSQPPLPEPNHNLNELQDLEELTYGPLETVANVEETLAKEEQVTNVCAEETAVVAKEERVTDVSAEKELL